VSWRSRAFGASASLAVALVAGALAAYAWSATGSGSGTAKDRTAVPITVVADSGAADLYPGGSAGAIHFKLTNGNPYRVKLTAVAYGTPTVASAPNATSAQPCPDAAVKVDPAAPLTLSITLAPGDTGIAASVPGVLDLDPTAGDGCQGATFSVPITLTGGQV
jgi:hypothetical protein